MRMRSGAAAGRPDLPLSVAALRAGAGWSRRSRPWNKAAQVGRAVPQWAWAFALYLVISVVTLGHSALANPGHVIVGWDGFTDPSGYMWSLVWWPYALLHGLNPFFTHAIWAPTGTNVAAAATIPAAAIALWPVTALFGPVVSYNVLAILSPPLCGLTAYLLCRRLTDRHGASLMGGLLFAFSSYQLTESLGHANLALVFLLPVGIHLVLRRVAGELSRARFIAALAVVFVVQALLSTEILIDAGMVGAAALAIAYCAAPRSTRPRIATAVVEVVIAGTAASVLLLPYLLAALAQGQLFRGGDAFGLNALNLIVPTPLARLGGWTYLGLSGTFENGNYTETAGYIGLPLLVVFATFAITSWRTSRATRVLVLTFVVSLVLALGSALQVGGHDLIALPWSLLDRLPLLGSLVPGRIVVFSELIVAICAALWLAQGARGKPIRWLIAFIGVAALFPNVGAGWWASQPENPTFFQTTEYRNYLTRGESVLAIPFAFDGDSMLWQAETSFYFTMPGGYISSVVPTAAGGAAVTDLVAGSSLGSRMPATITPTIRAFLRQHHIHHIVIQPGYQRAWTAVLSQIAPPPRRIGGILLYTVKPTARVARTQSVRLPA
jgi:hypothetical protein